MKQIVDLSILIFVVCSIASVGLELKLAQVAIPLTRLRLVGSATIANFVIVPLATLGLVRLIPLSEPFATGLILLAAAAGAPFLPKLIETASGDVPVSAALTVLLLVISQAYLPLVLPRMVPGVSVNSWEIFQLLLLTMVLPLSAAMLLNAWHKQWAVRLRPVLNFASNTGLVLALILCPILHRNSFAGLIGSHAIIVSLLFIAVSFGAGYLLGSLTRTSCLELAFGTATRNYSAALLISHQNFADPKVSIMVMVAAVVSLVVLVSAAIVSRRRQAGVVAHRQSAITQPVAAGGQN